jgi:hypothetical protein
MSTTTQLDPDDELETLVMKLNSHARFLTSAAYEIHAGVPESSRPARHSPDPAQSARRNWESCWNRNA